MKLFSWLPFWKMVAKYVIKYEKVFLTYTKINIKSPV